MNSESQTRYPALLQLFRFRKFIAVSTFVVTAFSIFYVLIFVQKWYAATINMVPPRKPLSGIENALSSVSSALKDFGVSKIGGTKSESYTMLVLLQSRTLRDTIIDRYHLTRTFDVPDTAMTDARSAWDENVIFAVESEGNITATVYHPNRDTAEMVANDIAKELNILSTKIDRSESSTNRRLLDERMTMTDSVIVVLTDSIAAFSKKTGLVSPIDQAKAVMESLAETKAEMMKQDIVLSVARNMYGDGDPQVQAQSQLVDKLKSDVSDFESKPGFAGKLSVDQSVGPAAKFLKMYAELEAYSKLRAFLSPSLQQARLDESKTSPTVYVLDPAMAEDKPSRPKRSLIVLGAFVSSLVLSCMIVLVLPVLAEYKLRLKELSEHANK